MTKNAYSVKSVVTNTAVTINADQSSLNAIYCRFHLGIVITNLSQKEFESKRAVNYSNDLFYFFISLSFRLVSSLADQCNVLCGISLQLHVAVNVRVYLQVLVHSEIIDPICQVENHNEINRQFCNSLCYTH